MMAARLLVFALWILGATVIGGGVASVVHCCVKVVRGIRTIAIERGRLTGKAWADSDFAFSQAKIDILFGSIVIPLSLVMILIGLTPFFLELP